MDFDKLSVGLDELLSKPVGAHTSKAPDVLTKEIVSTGTSYEVTYGSDMEDAPAKVLEAEGLDPSQWEVTGFRKSEWGDKTATKFSFRRRSQESIRASLSDDELSSLEEVVKVASTATESFVGTSTVVILVADTQLGKKESDPAECIARTYRHIDTALEQVYMETNVKSVVIAFMGDHIEGFVSQGGANAWRTPMNLTEQIRLTRRMMIYALKRAVSYGFNVKMVAVPSNHGQAVRFNNKGVTTYDDDHCVEALISVHDAVKMITPGTSSEYFGAEFYVPDNDELAVSLELSGTHVVFCHGHMAKPGKYTDYVKGQAFNRQSVYHNADVVCFGHFHEFRVEMSTDRMIIVAPAGEAESTWFRHVAGAGGYPAIIWFDTFEGDVRDIHLVR